MRIELLTAAAFAQGQKHGAADILLKNGDIAKGLVVKAGADGQLLISLNGSNTLKAWSAPGMHLMAGERLVLQVCKQDSGKTQLQVLARDGAASETGSGREAGMQPGAAQGNMAANMGQSTGKGMRAASDNAVLELCRLLSEAPGIGKALQKATQALQEQPGPAEEAAVRPDVQGNHSKADAPVTPVPQKAILMQPEANVQKQVQEQSARPAKPAVRLPDYAAELAEASQPAKQNAAAAAVGTAQASARRAGAPAGTQDVEVRPAVSEQNTVRLEDTGAQSGRVSPFAQDNRSVPAPVLPELRESLMRDMKALFVRPDAPEFDGESLQRQIESLNRSLAELGAQAASAGAEGKALAAQLETYAAQLRQQEQIQQFTYLQIPVMLREKESTAELYVFHRDKHGKPASPGATVVMLVLDTQSMGRVESVVRAEDRKVHIRMRVENERVAQMFEGKTALLDKALEEEGYTLTRMACSVAGTPVSPQNAQETAFNLLKDGTRRLDVVI